MKRKRHGQRQKENKNSTKSGREARPFPRCLNRSFTIASLHYENFFFLKTDFKFTFKIQSVDAIWLISVPYQIRPSEVTH